MNFLGADHYYFWLGVKAAIYRLCDEHDMGPNISTRTQEKCLRAYMDGFIVGLEMDKLEYKELINGVY